mgnify:CR=1 FL=1
MALAPTMWSANDIDVKNIEPTQKSAVQALEQIQTNPSPLVVSALSQPIFDACSIVAKKGNADSRESSTAAGSSGSSKNDDHVTLAKTLLVSIMKDVPRDGPPPVKKVRTAPANSSTGGKNAVGNRRQKDKAIQKAILKKLESRIAEPEVVCWRCERVSDGLPVSGLLHARAWSMAVRLPLLHGGAYL